MPQPTDVPVFNDLADVYGEDGEEPCVIWLARVRND